MTRPLTTIVYPPLWDSIDSPPLGPAVLAGALRAADLPVGMVDLNLDFHDWLFADDTLDGLLSAMLGPGSEPDPERSEEIAGLRVLSAAPVHERATLTERTAPLMALGFTLGMLARPLLGPQRFLVGVDSSKVRLHDLITGGEDPRLEFWERWIETRIEQVVAPGPAVVTMTISYVGQLLPAIIIARCLRRVLPSLRIIVGGPWCTHQAVSAIDLRPLFAVFDGIGVGPGDHVVARVAEHVEGGGEGLPTVPGLWITGHPRPELDRPAPTRPDFSIMPLARYFAGTAPQFPLESSRGCWAACRYCNYPALNRGYRVKAITQILEEVTDVQDRYPGAEITFVDDTILPKRALLMAAEIQAFAEARGHRVEWSGCIRPDSKLDTQQCAALAAGGVKRVFIGFDAATQDMLDNIDKRASLADLRVLVGDLKAAGITVAGNFIVGLPGETKRARAAIFEMMDELGLDPHYVTTSLFALVRGSWYYENMDEVGWPEAWVEQVRANDVLTDFLPSRSLAILQ